ncbi:MAG: formate--tetrahydrofolate ligase, partial [Sedimenticola sp.]
CFDLGAEKFFDIKCRSSGLWPSAVVLVVTVRALRIHGCAGGDSSGGMDELERGMQHLDHHVKSVRAFGFEPVIAINCFESDSEEELAAVECSCAQRGLRAARISAYTEGGAGAEQLARAVVEAADSPRPEARYLYDLDQSPEEKISAVARTIYGAGSVSFSRQARKELDRLRCLGYDKLPICIAKTHLSLSTDPEGFCQPEGFELPVESVRVAAGAGYLLALTGDIVTMPGLPREPAAQGIDIDDDGVITGI